MLMPTKKTRRLLWLIPVSLFVGLIMLTVNRPSAEAIKNTVIRDESDLADLAAQISGPAAVDCGDYTIPPYSRPYPVFGDRCAANAFREGNPFRVHACYWQTDTAGCYWIVGTPQKEIYFFLYTYFGWGDSINPPYSCFTCEERKPVIQLCPQPVIIAQEGREALQCLSFPDSWFDTFHIGLKKGGDDSTNFIVESIVSAALR